MVRPFQETCAGCHQGGILGKERIAGSKGIPFLTLPGIDLITINKHNARIGEWPELSEAELTPFMKVLLSRTPESAELVKTVEELDLQDLTQATDEEVAAVANLVWEIKSLFVAVVSGTNSDVLADFPLDVVLAAQKQWLPNLLNEMASRAEAEADAPAKLTPASAPVQSGVTGESWAEYGGWYRQDHTIYYRPTEHKDPFIRMWLDLTGPYAHDGSSTHAAQIFAHLTKPGAPGDCVKCHSIDKVEGKGHKVNWSPASPETKTGRFTTFTHEPHFGAMSDKSCLTCHELQRSAPYRDSFKENNPMTFVSGFSSMKKDLCQTCHTQGVARQDCMLCHKYHINGIVTPMLETKLPTQSQIAESKGP
ncbi:MAG: hypothetical protein KTR19_07050, partial [Hyphomicrobiales bacterium]|nr:hypothetical protein [Hyphomicrobiales bacterium]